MLSSFSCRSTKNYVWPDYLRTTICSCLYTCLATKQEMLRMLNVKKNNHTMKFFSYISPSCPVFTWE